MAPLSDAHLIFDSHAHLISEDHERYPTAPLSGALRPGDLDDPMTAERLIEEMDANGVAYAAVVQRGHIYGFDNSYVCDAAAMYPKRLSAVCSIDGRDAACGHHVREWVERGAAGVRMMEPFKGADPSWFAGPVARPIWRSAADLGIPVCVHFFRWNRVAGLAALLEVVTEFPEVTVVVDHFSNMHCESGAPDHGLDEPLLKFADRPRVFTKFTTIPLGQLDEQQIDAAPIVTRVVQAFGASRVMWGSDVAQSKGSYQSMVRLADAATRLLTVAERRAVLCDAARSVYGVSG